MLCYIYLYWIMSRFLMLAFFFFFYNLTTSSVLPQSEIIGYAELHATHKISRTVKFVI